MSARYIALEGIEGAGKSSLGPQVAAALGQAGHDVVFVREPGGTPTGEAIRDVVLHAETPVEAWTEALLFAAARAQLVREVVAPALTAGRVVVSDRSVYSSLAYQGAGRGLGVEEVRTVNALGLGEAWPQLVVLLDVDPAVGLARQDEPDRIGGEGLAFQARVADAYHRLAAGEPDRFVVIDAGPGEEEVLTAIIEAIEARL